MFSWLFNVYIDAVMKEVKMGMGRMGDLCRKKNGDRIASCMEMTLFCAVNQKRN